MRSRKIRANIDLKTVEGFGKEWAAFDQTGLGPEEHERLFSAYFSCFPFDALPPQAEGFDLGCGSGRWAVLVEPRVGLLHCIDPAPEALDVARRRLGGSRKVQFHLATANDIPLADSSQDFGYSLGVLHHVPDTAAALRACVRKLKPGAPFLLYLYYRFDNRSAWFRALWRTTDVARRMISRLPFPLRKAITSVIAATVYFPLARTARLLERAGRDMSSLPLSAYRNNSFYTMRTDALDRFGTRLEQRFTRAEIREMMQAAGLERITFREDEPYWVACGYRAA
jgi:ubiquinone/menaquinone biosynthesis C-methylase UbiE